MRNNNSLSIDKLLTIISEIGGICFKKDLPPTLSFTFSDTSKATEKSKIQSANALIKKAIAKNYLLVINKTQNNLPHDYLLLTSEGIKHYCDTHNITEQEYRTKFDFSPRPFTFSALLNELTYSRVKLALYSCGVIVNSHVKPTLANLQDTSSDYTSELTSGIYYTDYEFRQFLSDSGKNHETFSNTKFQGILIKDDKILVIFATNPKTNRMLTIKTDDVAIIKQELSTFNKVVPNAFSFIGGFKTKTPRLENGTVTYLSSDRSYKEPYALIIDDGYAAIYSHAMGNRFGRVTLDKIDKNEDGVDAARSKRKAKVSESITNEQSNHRTLLKATTVNDPQPFKRIFVTCYGHAGLYSLYYLITQDENSWFDEAKELFNISELPNNKIANQIYPSSDLNFNNAHFIYMPVAELNELRKIHESDDYYSIVSYFDLLEPISHAVRSFKKGKDTVKFYYDTLIPAKNIGIYIKSGRLAGRELLETTLLKDNLMYKENEYRKLPTLFNMTTEQFYNSILEGKISYAEVTDKIKPSPYAKKKRYSRKYKHNVSTNIPTNLYKEIKKECARKGISVNQFILSLIRNAYPNITKDSEDKKEIIFAPTKNTLTDEETLEIIDKLLDKD